PMKAAALSAGAVSVMLAGSLLALPFLLPGQQLPVPGFLPEWLAASLGLAAASVLLFSNLGNDTALPAPGFWLLGFALFIVAQAMAGEAPYHQYVGLGLTYVLYAVTMVWLGAQ